jgi:hypothetical protein
MCAAFSAMERFIKSTGKVSGSELGSSSSLVRKNVDRDRWIHFPNLLDIFATWGNEISILVIIHWWRVHYLPAALF